MSRWRRGTALPVKPHAVPTENLWLRRDNDCAFLARRHVSAPTDGLVAYIPAAAFSYNISKNVFNLS